MIRRIRGEVVDVAEQNIVVEVGGVGYLLSVARGSFTLGSSVELWTYLAVRETALDLYAFHTRDELQMFEHLLSLPKIGPKTALSILTQANIELIKEAAAKNDAVYLSKMSGIGKKSAEKIVAGLADKYEGYEVVGSGGNTAGDTDVIDALIALGYSERDARNTLSLLPPESIDTNARITMALKILGK